MPERDLDARIDAVERALTDGDTDLSELQDAADVVDDVRDLESRIADLESRIDDLEAGLQAVRGYAGNVRAVNREVERRASAALAKAETLETAVEDINDRTTDSTSQGQPRTGGDQEQGDWRGPDEPAPHATNSMDAEPRPAARLSRTEEARGTPRQRGPDPSVAGSEGPATGRSAGRETGQDDPGEPTEPAQDADSSQTEAADSSQTEQFIERVRDAL